MVEEPNGSEGNVSGKSAQVLGYIRRLLSAPGRKMYRRCRHRAGSHP